MSARELERAIAVLGRVKRLGGDSETAPVESQRCPECKGDLVFYVVQTPRSSREKPGDLADYCPTCHHGRKPDGARPKPKGFVPQTLVREDALPRIEPGQLRCQRCAHGVEGNGRFCLRCTRRGQGSRTYAEKPCLECGALFTPTGPRSSFCEDHQ